MKLRLPRKMQAGTRIKVLQGSALDALHFRQSGAMCRCQFLIEHIRRFTGRHEQVTIQPFKVTVDFLLSDDRLDAVYGRGMTLSSKLCAFPAVHAFDLKVAIIESVDQMRRGSRRFPARDRSIVQNDYGLPFLC